MGKSQIPETSDQWTDKLSSENGAISDPRKQNGQSINIINLFFNQKVPIDEDFEKMKMCYTKIFQNTDFSSKIGQNADF